VQGRAKVLLPRINNDDSELILVSHRKMQRVWQELVTRGYFRFAVRSSKPEYLLWCLLFLKNYSTEEIHSTIIDSYEKRFRKWAWFFAEGIAALDRKFVRGFVLH
jgi:hypothetical protein